MGLATSGARLLQADAVRDLRNLLLPLATLVTPNVPEAEVLAYLTAADTEYSQTVKGIQTFSDFMLKTGYLKKSLENPGTIIWEQTDYED